MRRTTNAVVTAIRWCHQRGATIEAIAATFSLPVRTVRRIVHYETFRRQRVG